MRSYKKVLCFILSLSMIGGMLAGCGSQSAETSEPPESVTIEPTQELTESETEIQKAVELGLASEVPEDLNATIRYDQFCAMLTNTITLLYGGEYLDTWNELAANAVNESREMTRGDGAFALLTAATAAGMDTPQPNIGDYVDIGGINQGSGVDLFQIDNSLFPWLNQPYHNRETEQEEHWAMDFAARYPWIRRSPVSQKCLMEYDETWDMHYQEPFSMEDAICAAMRCYESWVPREYVKMTDAAATAYDASILTPELLTKESSLPEPTQSSLPSDWQGLCIDVKLTTRDRSDFRERDIYAASENGFNFVRVWLGFSTLGYPDYPPDKELVNVAELRDLDRLLAWAIKYDVHLSISMTNIPGYEQYEDLNHSISTYDDNWPDAERWELVRQYWGMLANRYKDIPGKYLSFSLCEEWSGNEEHQEDFSENWGKIVSDIRAVSPDRVLMAGFAFADLNVLPLAERMAELGVAIAAHPYFPNQITHLTVAEREANGFDGEPEWPMVWFPTIAFNRRNSPITISGDLGGKQLSVYVLNTKLGGSAVITADVGGKRLTQHQFSEGGAGNPMVISIPERTEELTLHASGELSLYCLKLEGDFGVSQIATTSFLFDDDGSNDAASLFVGTDGVWADKDGRLYDREAFYQEGIEPYLEITGKYGVGFMVNEFCMNNYDYEALVREPIPMETQLAYYADIINLFEERGIGYVLGCVSGVGGNVLTGDSGHFENYADYPNYIGTETFVNSYGFTETFKVNNILLNAIKKNIKE